MTIEDKLANVPGDESTDVVLQFEDEYHGLHYTDEFQEWGVTSTETVDKLAEAMVFKELDLKLPWSKREPINVLRDAGFLDEYERGSESFEGFLAEKIRENYWELDELLDLTTEQWDYKNGALFVSTELKTTLGGLRQAHQSGFDLSGWTIRVPSSPGELDVQF